MPTDFRTFFAGKPNVCTSKATMSSSTKTSGMCKSITLAPTGKHHKMARFIDLTGGRAISVGRSSHVAAKGRVATETNALFDCAVVSRQHAVIEVGPAPTATTWGNQSVTITDNNSTHGTFVNGDRIASGIPFELKVGDTVRLGESVNRTFDVHEGVTFKVVRIDHELPSQKRAAPTSKGYTVPSESEYDSDDVMAQSSQPISTSNFQLRSVVPDTYATPTNLDTQKTDVEAIKPKRVTRWDVGKPSEPPSPKETAIPEEAAGSSGSESMSVSNDITDLSDPDLIESDPDEILSELEDELEETYHESEDEDVSDQENEGPEITSSKTQASAELGDAINEYTIRENDFSSGAAGPSYMGNYTAMYDPVRGWPSEYTSQTVNSQAYDPYPVAPSHLLPPLPPMSGQSPPWLNKYKPYMSSYYDVDSGIWPKHNSQPIKASNGGLYDFMAFGKDSYKPTPTVATGAAAAPGHALGGGPPAGDRRYGLKRKADEMMSASILPKNVAQTIDGIYDSATGTLKFSDGEPAGTGAINASDVANADANADANAVEAVTDEATTAMKASNTAIASANDATNGIQAAIPTPSTTDASTSTADGQSGKQEKESDEQQQPPAKKARLDKKHRAVTVPRRSRVSKLRNAGVVATKVGVAATKVTACALVGGVGLIAFMASPYGEALTDMLAPMC